MTLGCVGSVTVTGSEFGTGDPSSNFGFDRCVHVRTWEKHEKVFSPPLAVD